MAVRFAALILFATCASCADTSGDLDLNDLDTTECWLDREGHLDSYLVLADAGEHYIPYVISRKCGDVDELIAKSYQFMIDDDHGSNMRRGMLDRYLINNTNVHGPWPSLASKIFIIKADVGKFKGLSYPDIHQLNIISIKPSGKVLGDYIPPEGHISSEPFIQG